MVSFFYVNDGIASADTAEEGIRTLRPRPHAQASLLGMPGIVREYELK